MAEINTLAKEVADALATAETKINTLAFSCGQELGDYERLQSLARHAATVHSIRVGITESMKPTQPAPSGVSMAESQIMMHRQPLNAQVTYPSFHVEGGALVLRNRRRNGHELYAHRVPKEQYERIAKAFARILEKSPIVSTPRLMEACSDMPAYLPRTVVAMLKKMKIATGPRGVVMFKGNNLESTMLKKWTELMEGNPEA